MGSIQFELTTTSVYQILCCGNIKATQLPQNSTKQALHFATTYCGALSHNYYDMKAFTIKLWFTVFGKYDINKFFYKN